MYLCVTKQKYEQRVFGWKYSHRFGANTLHTDRQLNKLTKDKNKISKEFDC
jgi:hypothetical protein